MASVSDEGSSYSARMERVSGARANLEERLAKRLELMDGYSKVRRLLCRFVVLLGAVAWANSDKAPWRFAC